MASKNSIGGFFMDLALQLDKNSFETGNKYIDGMTSGFNKLIGTARNAAVVLATTAIASGAVSSAELKVATSMGISTEALDNWKAAANIAGVNANGLVSSMGKLASVMNHLDINGQGLQQYSQVLSELGMSVTQLEGMDPAAAFQTILEKAQEVYNSGDDKIKLRTTVIVGDILGTEGQNFFSEINRKGISVQDFITGAAATQFMIEQDRNNGANFMAEVNKLKEEVKSATQLLGTSVGAELTKYVKSISDWILENKDDITNGIKTIAEGIGRIADKVAGPLGDAAKGAGNLIVGAAAGDINQFSEGATQIGGAVGFGFSAGYQGISYGEAKSRFEDQTSLIKVLANLYKENGGKKLSYDDLPIDIKEAVDKYGGKKRWAAYMNDGIMRPDGTITRVAPDDWVFAARNVSDLARAFIPQGITEGTEGVNTFSIVQNFTINGAKDLSQTLRQQAYNGTRDGLMQTMAQSSRRLQQMSGTR